MIQETSCGCSLDQLNRAPRAHALRSAGRGIEATGSGALHRTTCARRRDKTLPLLNEFVARADPVHLQGVACPSESDTKEHNDYKAKVRARANASSRGGSAGDPRERRQLLEGLDAADPQGAHRPHRPQLLGLRCSHAIWEFAPKRYPKIFSHILRYPKISLNSNKSKDKFYGYERISLTG